MPELVIMPPSPNKPPQPQLFPQSGKKPAALPSGSSTKRLSIKDYFSVMEPPPTSAAAAGSKKRKSAGDVGPVAKKPKAKPATTKAKKGGEPAQSSDKENGVNADTSMVSGGEGIITTTTTSSTTTTVTAPAKPKAPRKPRAPKDETAKKNADKGKAKVDQEAEDAALAAQLAREEATAASGVSAPGFQAVNVFKVSVGKPGEAAGHTFTAVNPVGEVIKVKSKAQKPKVEKEKKPKEPKVPKPKLEPEEKTPKPPKEPKAPKEPRVPKEPKALKEPKPPKVSKDKVPNADAPPKEKKGKPSKPAGEAKKTGPKPKVKGTATEIKEWKQYEPKNPAAPSNIPAAAGGIAKFLQQPVLIEAARPPPKLEPCPDLEHIEISYSFGVIHDRLVIREFFLRFEKSLKIVPKYINIVNNPNSDWTDLTYRSIIVCLLRLLHADNTPEISWEILDAGIQELEKTPPDDPKLWLCLTTIMHGFIDEDQYTNADWAQHKPRSQLIVRLVALATGSGIMRERVEKDAGLLKKEEKSAQEEIKSLKAEWEMNKQDIGKARLTAQGEERERLERKLKGEMAFMKSQVALVEARSWFRKRKLQPRQRPLGVDVKGNTYWLFVQREKRSEDWGRWIVIERALDLPHPSGSIPPHLLSPTVPPPPEPAPEEEGPRTEETIKKRIWYAISTSAEAVALVKWIRSTAEMVFYEREVAVAAKSKAAVAGGSLVRQRLQAVEVPMSPGMMKMMKKGPEEVRRLGVVVKEGKRWDFVRRDEVTKAGVEELCREVERVGGFWRLEEEGVGGKLME